MFFDFQVTHIQRVVDGDTFDIEVDLGFHTRTVKRFRLAGIDAAEIWGRNAEEAGTIQRDWVAEWLDNKMTDGALRVRSFPLNWNVPLADGGFGRWAAIIYDFDTLTFLSDELVDQGFTKLGEPLWIWDSVKAIQEEMKETYTPLPGTGFELNEETGLVLKA